MMMEREDYQEKLFFIFSIIIIALLSILLFSSTVSNYFDHYFTKPQDPKTPKEISGLVGYWRFDDNAKDSSGNNNHGKWIGKEIYKDGSVYGKAAEFNGSSYVTISHSSSIDVGKGAFSIGAWVNSDGNIDVNKNQHLLNKRTGGNKGLFWDMYLSGLVENINAEIAGHSFDNPPSTMRLNAWHHIFLTRDSSGLTTVYIDGKPIKKKSMKGDSSNTHAFNIGNLEGYLDQGFNGLIDEVVIYNRALNKKEVGSLYMSGKKH